MKEFVNLGMQPIANEYLNPDADLTNEIKFELAMGRDEKTGLCTLMDIIDSSTIYNDNYVYHSSGSQTMRDHFHDVAQKIKGANPVGGVLEIGSNDGAFLKWFDTSKAESVEPCGNFAKVTQEMGYRTLPNLWNIETAKELDKKYDAIYSANCICHIPDLKECFDAINIALDDEGVFVFEDPSLSQMLTRGSYDQIYVEHVHMFSVFSLQRVLEQSGLKIMHVEPLSTHGGSNRIFAVKESVNAVPENSVAQALKLEGDMGIFTNEATDKFGERVAKSKEDLINLLQRYNSEGKKVISYGSTAKSVTVFNYCGIDSSMINYVTDITPAKQGKLMPGVHIPVISPEEGMNEDVDVAFLGAWNFKDEILAKESAFIARGGTFVSHVPQVGEVNIKSPSGV